MPTSLAKRGHDTLAQRAYVQALGELPNAGAIPPVVLGAACFIVDPAGCNGTLEVLERVTSEFRNATNLRFEPFQWRVRVPEDVHDESPNFEQQSRLVLRPILTLDIMGTMSSSRVDSERRAQVKNIIEKSSELRQLLDAHTGTDELGDYRGLLAPAPWNLLEATAILRADELCPRAPGAPCVRLEGLNEHDDQVAYRVSMQDLLAAAEVDMKRQADMNLLRCRERQGLHRRFAF